MKRPVVLSERDVINTAMAVMETQRSHYSCHPLMVFGCSAINKMYLNTDYSKFYSIH